jgi:hypothetical protein
MSLQRLGDIVQMEVDPSDPDYVKILTLQSECAGKLITAAIRVDENALRKTQTDVLSTFLLKVREAKLLHEREGYFPGQELQSLTAPDVLN